MLVCLNVTVYADHLIRGSDSASSYHVQVVWIIDSITIALMH